MTAPPNRSPARGRPEHCLSLTVEATELGTRAALARIMAKLSAVLPDGTAGTVEIALAEILNNIVEHAYAGDGCGEIRILACADGSLLHVQVSDDGSPLPGLALPPGRAHDLSGPRADLPEGGFGWMLIRTIARDLHYERTGGTSILRVTFDIGEA